MSTRTGAKPHLHNYSVPAKSEPSDSNLKSQPQRHVKKHPRFWDATGNVILQIQSTLFRVHGSMLARHSRLFAGHAQGNVDIDGSSLPVLALITAKDFEFLLDAMENAV